jgi:hypothetical protein
MGAGQCDSQSSNCTTGEFVAVNDPPTIFDLVVTVYRVETVGVHVFAGTNGHRVRNIEVRYRGPATGSPTVNVYVNGIETPYTGSEDFLSYYPASIGSIYRATSDPRDARSRIVLKNVQIGGSITDVDVNSIVDLGVAGNLYGNVIARAAGATATNPGSSLGVITKLDVRGDVLGNIESTGAINLIAVGGNLGQTAANYVRARENIVQLIVGGASPTAGNGVINSSIAALLDLRYLSASSVHGDIYCRNLGNGSSNLNGIVVSGVFDGRLLVSANYSSANGALLSFGAIQNQLTFGAFNYVDGNGVLQPQPQPFQWLGAVSTSFGGVTRFLPTVPNPTTLAQEYSSGLIGGGAAGVFPFTVWRRDCSPPMIEGRAGMVTVANFMSGAANVVVNHNGPVARKDTAVGSASPVRVQYQNFGTYPATWENVPMNQAVSGRSVTLSRVTDVVYQPGRYRVLSQNLKSVVAGTQHPAVSFPNVADVSYGESAAYEFVLGGCIVGGNINPADVAGAGYNGLYPDGIIDGNDFVAFVNAFSAGDLLADIAGEPQLGTPCGVPDGTVDGDDWICFTNNFSLGC